MRHAARQLPSWLIFDVGQKRQNHVSKYRCSYLHPALRSRNSGFVGNSVPDGGDLLGRSAFVQFGSLRSNHLPRAKSNY